MKDRTENRMLLLALLSATLLYLGVLFWRPPVYFSWMRTTLFLTAHVLPAWMLQTLLLRLAAGPWLPRTPLLFLGLTATIGVLWIGCGIGGGWLVAAWTLAPAAGCLLGWLESGRSRWAALAGMGALLGVYLLLKHLAGMPVGEVWAVDVPVAMIALATLRAASGLWRNRRRKGQMSL